MSIETYDHVVNTILFTLFYIVAASFVLNCLRNIYHYALGNDFEDSLNWNKKGIFVFLDLLSPLTVKSPSDLLAGYFLTAIGLAIVAITWIVSIPLLTILVIASFCRQKNLEKKKMWQTLKD